MARREHAAFRVLSALHTPRARRSAGALAPLVRAGRKARAREVERAPARRGDPRRGRRRRGGDPRAPARDPRALPARPGRAAAHALALGPAQPALIAGAPAPKTCLRCLTRSVRTPSIGFASTVNTGGLRRSIGQRLPRVSDFRYSTFWRIAFMYGLSPPNNGSRWR